MSIFLILFIALVLRLVSINQSLWLDEATTALAANMSLADLFTKFLPGDFHPPLYYLTVKYWATIFGYSEVSLRFPSVIFGLGTVYLTYLIAKTLFTEKAALASSSLLATSGLAIYYSQEARMYGMAAFWVAAAVYFFLKKKWVYFAAALVLIGMTDYVALFVLPIFWLVQPKSRAFIASHVPLMLSFLIWLPIFAKQLTMGFSVKEALPAWWGILGTLTPKNLALIPVKFAIGRISFDNYSVYALVVIPIISFFAYILLKSIKSSKVLWLWLLAPVACGIAISVMVPTLTYFRFLFCLPALYLLMGNGLQKITGLKYTLAVFAVIAVNLTTSSYYLFNPRFHREDWRGLVTAIEMQKSENSVTMFLKESNTEAYRYYAPDAKIIGPRAAGGGYDEIWLMNYLKDVFDPEGVTRSNIENLGYTYQGELVRRGVGAIRFEK